MSNGNFHTKEKGSIQVTSNIATVRLWSYSLQNVEYEETSGKPAFDFKIGTKTMNDIGIILDFSANLISIDCIKLPMRSIDKLPTSNKEALGFNNYLAKNQEPKAQS